MPRRGQRPTQFACDKGKQCTAKSKRSGQRRRNYACKDRKTCRMHGGTSKRGLEHPNYKTGKYSKVTRNALKFLGKLLHHPFDVRIELYPEGLEETMETPWPERWFVHVNFDGWPHPIPLCERERILRAIRRKVSTRLRQLREKLAGNPSED